MMKNIIIDNLSVKEFIKKRRLQEEYKFIEYKGFDFFIGKAKKLDINGNTRYYIAIFKDNFNITSLLKNKQVFQYTRNEYGITNALHSSKDYDFLDFIILSLNEL